MLETSAPMTASRLQDRSSETAASRDASEKRGRKQSKEVRRLQLIEATIDSLARRGYSETTMADVADGAGLSRGIVNFHFESKEKLLVATLQFMADEYAAHWRSALQKAGDDPARQLAAVVAADFDRSICNKRKLAAWCAFWGEAKSRPTYQALCGAREVGLIESPSASWWSWRCWCRPSCPDRRGHDPVSHHPLSPAPAPHVAPQARGPSPGGPGEGARRRPDPSSQVTRRSRRSGLPGNRPPGQPSMCTEPCLLSTIGP